MAAPISSKGKATLPSFHIMPETGERDMKVTIDHTRADARHPDKTFAICRDLNNKLKKAGKPKVHAEDIVWSYIWAQQLGGEPLENCFVSLEGRLGGRISVQSLTDTGATPRSQLPAEITEAYRKGSDVDAKTYTHVTQFTVENHKGDIQTCLATSGYRSKSGVYVYQVTEGDETDRDGKAFEILFKIEGGIATWSGSLHHAAQDRFEKTKPGGSFAYRSSKIKRLTDDEIRNLVEGQHFRLVIGP